MPQYRVLSCVDFYSHFWPEQIALHAPAGAVCGYLTFPTRQSPVSTEISNTASLSPCQHYTECTDSTWQI
jgi:hypothetical protein